MIWGFANINGASLYYEMTGEGQPLVMLHTGITDSTMWDYQFYVFGEHFQVVRYDLRGFGRSLPVEGTYSHHDDLRALLDHLGIEHAYLMGGSLGGMTCVDFALTHPERVDGLILVGTGLGGYVSPNGVDSAPDEDEAEAALEAGEYVRAAEFETRWWVDGPKRKSEQVNPALRDRVTMMNAVNLEYEARGLGEEQDLEPPAAQRLSELHTPLLVIVGDLDRFKILEVADLLAAEVPGAQKFVMHGTAHVPSMEQPEIFNGLVLSWLQTHIG